jgi:hypothetical protein
MIWLLFNAAFFWLMVDGRYRLAARWHSRRVSHGSSRLIWVVSVFNPECLELILPVSLA